MSDQEFLGEFDQFVLLAIVHLREGAYGVTIRREIEQRSGRSISIAATYATLGRLERARYVSSWVSDPTPVRGGRARKHFKIEAAGALALERSREALSKMWKGLETLPAPQG